MKKTTQLLLGAVLSCTVVSTAFAATTFADVTNHWAAQDIAQLVSYNAVGGYSDGTFRPDGTITRAEFSKILCKSLGYETHVGNSFSDTASHWAAGDVQSLVSQGIIVPTDYGNQYEPDINITRTEIAVMLIRALGLNQQALQLAGSPTTFIDDAQIASFSKGYIVLATQYQLIGGYLDNSFGPNHSATRAEACAMILRLLQQNQTNTPPNATAPETSLLDHGTKNSVSFQVSNLSSALQPTNALQEQYIYYTFDLTINNHSSTSLSSTSGNIKWTTTYAQSNGKTQQAIAYVQPYTDVIVAGNTLTRKVTVQVLLPNNPVAQLSLGTTIQNFDISFIDQKQSTADLATTVNTQDHNISFPVLSQSAFALK